MKAFALFLIAIAVSLIAIAISVVISPIILCSLIFMITDDYKQMAECDDGDLHAAAGVIIAHLPLLPLIMAWGLWYELFVCMPHNKRLQKGVKT